MERRVKPKGHALGKFNRRNRTRREIGRIKNDELGSVDRAIPRIAQQPSLALTRRFIVGNEQPLVWLKLRSADPAIE